MTSDVFRYSPAAWLLAAVLALSACGGGGGSGGGGGGGDGADPTPNQPEEEVPDRFTEGRTFRVEPGPDATADMVDAMIRLKPRDTLEFGCGYFELDEGLLIQATENVRVKGCGKDKTVLSFRDSVNVTGLEALNVRGLVVEGITILDSRLFAFKGVEKI